MPKKGSTFQRTPQKDHTRSDSSLTLECQRQLLLEFESIGFKRGDNIAHLVARNPTLFDTGDPKHARAIRDRVRLLLSKKENSPAEYW